MFRSERASFNVGEGGGQLTELLDAVLVLETLALANTLGAFVKVVLERSAGFGLLAFCSVCR